MAMAMECEDGNGGVHGACSTDGALPSAVERKAQPPSHARPCTPSHRHPPLYATKEKSWGKKDHTSFVLGITCIRDNEAVCSGKARILCIKDSLYYGTGGKDPSPAHGMHSFLCFMGLGEF